MAFVCIWIDIQGLRRDKSPIHADRIHVHKSREEEEKQKFIQRGKKNRGSLFLFVRSSVGDMPDVITLVNMGPLRRIKWNQSTAYKPFELPIKIKSRKFFFPSEVIGPDNHCELWWNCQYGERTRSHTQLPSPFRSAVCVLGGLIIPANNPISPLHPSQLACVSHLVVKSRNFGGRIY